MEKIITNLNVRNKSNQKLIISSCDAKDLDKSCYYRKSSEIFNDLFYLHCNR